MEAHFSEKTGSGKSSFNRRRFIFLGQDSDSIIKKFFGSNALVTILVLSLITIFLFKEGAVFFHLYKKSLKEYRLSGLEYVDILKETREDYTSLTRYVGDIKAKWIDSLRADGLSQSEINRRVMSPEAKNFFFGYMRAGSELRGFVKKKMDVAIETRNQYTTNKNLRETLGNYEARIEALSRSNYVINEADRTEYEFLFNDYLRKNPLAATAEFESVGSENLIRLLENKCADIERTIQPVDFGKSIRDVIDEQESYRALLQRLELKLRETTALADLIDFNDPVIEGRIERLKEFNEIYFKKFDPHLERVVSWDSQATVSIWQTFGAFFIGQDWVTASEQQDWYGLLPLLSGSLLISSIALLFAIPFGIGAAIYVNQIAGPAERNFIKPYIEFVSAIPSVVIGFFGVVIFGEAIRLLSQQEFLQWISFFPIQDRLNAFTAGCLLALMAIPTIFTLAEDAINNIPRHLKEASLAIGATPLQTTFKVILPAALSGMISAIMLGFGRVIGETMVVLLCAGNRIKIPNFTEGMGVFFEPVHTMTGIVAQEMGEVVHGSLHYRALFMVGIVLFFISLLINYGAQWMVKRYRKKV